MAFEIGEAKASDQTTGPNLIKLLGAYLGI